MLAELQKLKSTRFGMLQKQIIQVGRMEILVAMGKTRDYLLGGGGGGGGEGRGRVTCL